MNSKTKAAIGIACGKIVTESNFTLREFGTILDHVTNSDFVEKDFLTKEVPTLTQTQIDSLIENKIRFEQDMSQTSALIHEVLGGREGTGIDETTFIVGFWGTKQLKQY